MQWLKHHLYSYRRLVLLFGVLVATYPVMSYLDTVDQHSNQRNYCDNVETYLLSDGEYGWPPYKGIALCDISQHTNKGNP